MWFQTHDLYWPQYVSFLCRNDNISEMEKEDFARVNNLCTTDGGKWHFIKKADGKKMTDDLASDFIGPGPVALHKSILKQIITNAWPGAPWPTKISSSSLFAVSESEQAFESDGRWWDGGAAVARDWRSRGRDGWCPAAASSSGGLMGVVVPPNRVRVLRFLTAASELRASFSEI
jgi:hypothetical protein